jgi:hypothetical protein
VSNFAAFKFDWLRRVATDARLPRGTARLAIIFCDYFNRENRTAWPSIDLLARDLSITGRAVQTTVAALVERGHLTVDTGGGRNKTNQYRPVIKILNAENPEASFTLSGEEMVKEASPFVGAWVKIGARKGEESCKERVKDASPESRIKEPLKEPLGRKAAGHGSGGSVGKEASQDPNKAAKLNGSAVAFPALDEDPRAVLFGEAADWLGCVSGRQPASVKSLIGQMLKTGRDDAGLVLATVRDAKQRNVAAPVDWIMGALKARSPLKPATAMAVPSCFKLSKPASRI